MLNDYNDIGGDHELCFTSCILHDQAAIIAGLWLGHKGPSNNLHSDVKVL